MTRTNPSRTWLYVAGIVLLAVIVVAVFRWSSGTPRGVDPAPLAADEIEPFDPADYSSAGQPLDDAATRRLQSAIANASQRLRSPLFSASTDRHRLAERAGELR